MISLSESESPKAVQQTQTGEFAFVSVPPGKYGLVILTPGGSTVIADETGNNIRLVEVIAGQVVDLKRCSCALKVKEIQT